MRIVANFDALSIDTNIFSISERQVLVSTAAVVSGNDVVGANAMYGPPCTFDAHP